MSDFKRTYLRRAKRVKKTSILVLGYTRAGRAVFRPMHDVVDASAVDTLFADWARGDHVDAARILIEHGARESDPIASWCARWSSAHRRLSKGRTTT